MNEDLARAHLRPKSENSPPAASPEPSTGFQFLQAAHAQQPAQGPLAVAPIVNRQITPAASSPPVTSQPPVASPYAANVAQNSINRQWINYWNGKAARPQQGTVFTGSAPLRTSAPQLLQTPNRATNEQWMNYWNGRGPRPAANTYYDPRYHQIDPVPITQQWTTQGVQAPQQAVTPEVQPATQLTTTQAPVTQSSQTAEKKYYDNYFESFWNKYIYSRHGGVLPWDAEFGRDYYAEDLARWAKLRAEWRPLP
jgi:hypothetical protein